MLDVGLILLLLLELGLRNGLVCGSKPERDEVLMFCIQDGLQCLEARQCSSVSWSTSGLKVLFLKERFVSTQPSVFVSTR
jgi:hypothetical protein